MSRSIKPSRKRNKITAIAQLGGESYWADDERLLITYQGKKLSPHQLEQITKIIEQ